MERRGNAAGRPWASALTDLLALAALAKANQAGTPQRTLRQECLHDSGPRIAYNRLHASANRIGANASAWVLAAPRALDA
jgi:hypothetical protein